MTNPLRRLEAAGQSIWLDYLHRKILEDGELKRLIDEDGLKGLTSNPSIFEKAIADSDAYEGALKAFLAEGDRSVQEIYEHLAIADVRGATDILRPVYDATGGADGFASLECSPYLADDTEATIAEAERLWAAVDRPNLMIKVPATPAGLPAIRDLIARGLNVNITLLFAVEVYEQVAEAYISGLEALAAKGGDVSRVASVASFFVSRIDSAVEKKLQALGDAAATDRLDGKVAIANAKLAYSRYKAIFSGPRWQALAAKGARTQRVLWASTSTKNKAFPDTLYVESLVGRDTIDTLPPATLDAFRDHGRVTPDAVEHDLVAARETLAELEAKGISLKAITDDLTVDGVKQFADAFDRLFAAIAKKRRGSAPGLAFAAGDGALRDAWEAELEAWRRDGRVRRLWAGDAKVWTDADEAKWLGWLSIVERELDDVGRLEAFAETVKQRGFSDVVLIGMGGSSLGPEVLAGTFGPQAGWPQFHMIDSTDPSQVRTLEAAIDIARTLFIVSSKSGGTLEPNILLDYFLDRATAASPDAAKRQFVAITDPGSSLQRRANEADFAHIFLGDPAIGGRYSVLSRFGLAPAASIGLDVRRLLEAARSMQRDCGPDVPPAENPGVQLGVALGVAAAKFGRDKVTILASPGIASLGAWLEQLLAESTGKHGRGLIPVDAEPLLAPERYGRDRLFACLELAGHADPDQHALADALERLGHPVVRIALKDRFAIAGEFFRWEIATAVAGAILDLNPFDQPDVEASKQKTKALTDAYEASHALPEETPVFRENGVALYADPRNAAELGRHNTLPGYLKQHFGRLGAGDYAALLAYVERNAPHTEVLTGIRRRIGEATGAATCLGFGPRFQHSSGQAYKGGPNSGVVLQITCDHAADVDVPGHGYSFGVVEAAQARGDLEVLVERGRRALRVHLHDVDTGLKDLARAMDEALQ